MQAAGNEKNYVRQQIAQALVCVVELHMLEALETAFQNKLITPEAYGFLSERVYDALIDIEETCELK